MQFTLVEIHDIDDDHEVGGQDLPNLVTVRVEGCSIEGLLALDLFNELEPFNLQQATRHQNPGHLEFMTFAFANDIRAHFGVPPEKSKADLDFERLFKNAYVMTVGELKAALVDLPDDMPLVHTPHQPPGQHLANRKGLQVLTGEWAFTGPGLPTWGGSTQWSLRIGPCDLFVWEKVMVGTWYNFTGKDLRG